MPAACAHSATWPRARRRIAGWFNLLGGAAATAGVAFTSAQLLANYILLSTGTAAGGGYLAPQGVLLAIYAGVLLYMGVVNAFASSKLDIIGDVSVWFHTVGLAVFTIVLPLVAPTHQPASYVFTTFVPDDGLYAGGWCGAAGLPEPGLQQWWPLVCCCAQCSCACQHVMYLHVICDMS